MIFVDSGTCSVARSSGMTVNASQAGKKSCPRSRRLISLTAPGTAVRCTATGSRSEGPGGAPGG